MNQITSLIDQALSIARRVIRVLLAAIIIAVGFRLLGVRVPFLTVTDGNLQSVAAFLAAAAYVTR
jgi:hypothetical protein